MKNKIYITRKGKKKEKKNINNYVCFLVRNRFFQSPYTFIRNIITCKNI